MGTLAVIVFITCWTGLFAYLGLRWIIEAWEGN